MLKDKKTGKPRKQTITFKIIKEILQSALSYWVRAVLVTHTLDDLSRVTINSTPPFLLWSSFSSLVLPWKTRGKNLPLDWDNKLLYSLIFFFSRQNLSNDMGSGFLFDIIHRGGSTLVSWIVFCILWVVRYTSEESLCGFECSVKSFIVRCCTMCHQRPGLSALC